MKNRLFKHNDFYLLLGELEESHFKISPIWCEYYQPEELRDLNVPYEWFDENLFSHISGVNLDAYYATPDKIDYSKREFINVYCDVFFANQEFKGYLFLSRGEINSVEIFADGETAYFCISELVDENNSNEVKKLLRYKNLPWSNLSSLTYSISIEQSLFNLIPPQGTFNFPIIKDV